MNIIGKMCCEVAQAQFRHFKLFCFGKKVIIIYIVNCYYLLDDSTSKIYYRPNINYPLTPRLQWKQYAVRVTSSIPRWPMPKAQACHKIFAGLMVSIDDLTFSTNVCSRVYVPFDKTRLYPEKYAWKQHQIQKCKGKREPFECDVMNISLWSIFWWN